MKEAPAKGSGSSSSSTEEKKATRRKKGVDTPLPQDNVENPFLNVGDLL